MKQTVVLISLLLLSGSLPAANSEQSSEILATRGKGVITQGIFTVRADKIPAESRLGTLRDKKRLQDVINNLLLNSQLVAEAREAGFDKDPMVQARMQLAAEAELGDAWVQHYKEIQPAADYEQLAREYYQLHKKEIMTSPKVDVSHILITTKDRSPEEALELAQSLRNQLEDDPSAFDQMITQYSEDPSAAANQGKFHNVRRGAMVKAFEDAAFSMEEGEIAAPVRTEYGYHIIRLDALIAPQQMAFEEVEQRLIDMQKKQHENRIMMDYIGGLTALDVTLSEEALNLLVDRLFGEDYVDPYTNPTE